MPGTSPEGVDNGNYQDYDSGMNEPKSVLGVGTKIITSIALHPTTGIMVKPKYFETRRPSTVGTIQGFVPGHGGDIYWVQHEDESIAVYGWQEFELADDEDIEAHKPDHERAVEALQDVVVAQTSWAKTHAAAKALGKIGAPLPDDPDPAVKEVYEEAKK